MDSTIGVEKSRVNSLASQKTNFKKLKKLYVFFSPSRRALFFLDYFPHSNQL